MKKKIYLLGVLSAAFALQSCIDNNYDLDDIDMKLGNNVDLTLPSSSTGDIVLKSIMNLEEDGVVQFIEDENGQSIFAVIQDGEADIDPISIDRISLNPELSEINTTVDLAELVSNSSVPQLRKVKVATPMGDIDIVDAEYNYPIGSNSATYKIDANDPNAKSPVSNDIVSIDKVVFEENTKLSLDMHIENFPYWLPTVALENLTLRCPADLMIAHCRFGGKDIPLSADGLYHLTGKEDNEFSFTEPIKLELVLEGATIGENLKFDVANHEVMMDGDFEINGNFRVSTKDIDSDLLEAYLKDTDASKVREVYETKTILPILPVSLTFKGKANFGDGITLKYFYGKVQHEVESIDPIKLDELPDFLKEEDVVLDLDNPILLLSARQEFPVSVHTAVELSAVYDGVAGGETLKAQLEVPAASADGQMSRFYIADRELVGNERNILPEAYREATYLPLEQGKLSALIKKIPSEIRVEIPPITMDASQTPVDLLRTYAVDVEYKVYAPLTLGPDFKLVYRGEENGWAEDLEDFEDMNVGEIQVTAEVTSNLPAAVNLTATPIDAAENSIQSQFAKEFSVRIAPQSTSHISITLKAGDKFTLNDILTGKHNAKQIDGVKYEARIDEPIDKASLPENAYIKLTNIKVTIKGGVSYDAN